jgi:hypothetical protein
MYLWEVYNRQLHLYRLLDNGQASKLNWGQESDQKTVYSLYNTLNLLIKAKLTSIELLV